MATRKLTGLKETFSSGQDRSRKAETRQEYHRRRNSRKFAKKVTTSDSTWSYWQTTPGLAPHLTEPSYALGDAAVFQTEIVPVRLEALSGDGKMKPVPLYADGKLVGTAEQAPYAFNWRVGSNGPHGCALWPSTTARTSQRPFIRLRWWRTCCPANHRAAIYDRRRSR